MSEHDIIFYNRGNKRDSRQIARLYTMLNQYNILRWKITIIFEYDDYLVAKAVVKEKIRQLQLTDCKIRVTVIVNHIFNVHIIPVNTTSATALILRERDIFNQLLRISSNLTRAEGGRHGNLPLDKIDSGEI